MAELGDIDPLTSAIVTVNMSRRSIQKHILPAAAVAGTVLRVGAGLAARAAGVAARAAVRAARNAIRVAVRNARGSTRAQWITYVIQVAYSYVCNVEITRTIPVVLKKLVLIESPVPQPIITQIGCVGCIGGSIGTGGISAPVFNLDRYSARTPSYVTHACKLLWAAFQLPVCQLLVVYL